MNNPALIRALFSPACYDHAVTPIRLIETHISWVLLTGEYAYKIKKPLDLGFLDFSTLAFRQQACADEVLLNRRLAADMYLGVVAITGSLDSPKINATSQIDGQCEAIEYAVKMRQFPPDATLDHLDERGELGAAQIDVLAVRLARFHLIESPKAPLNSTWGTPDTIARSVTENFQLLADRLDVPAETERLERLQSWSIAEHERLTPLMLKRKSDGRIRECHGDLHLGNLAWVNGELLIFDCIEFSPALRWIDVISEVAFCFMDLLYRQHHDLAMRLLNTWLEASGDYGGVALLRYYVVYRALVRAKVALLRAGQAGSGDAEVVAYLQLAERLVQHAPARLWITHGLSGSGKTTLTQSLLEKRGMIRLRSDVERKRLAGMDTLAHSGSGINGGLYTRETSRRTYAHLASLANGLLDAGWQAIIDAAFLERWQRDLFRKIAQRLDVQFRILDIQTDLGTLRERVGLRAAQGKDASEADLRVLQHQIKTAQPFGANELLEVVPISGTDVPVELYQGNLFCAPTISPGSLAEKT